MFNEHNPTCWWVQKLNSWTHFVKNKVDILMTKEIKGRVFSREAIEGNETDKAELLYIR